MAGAQQTLQTAGWCNPIIINNTGRVTFHCDGVDPAAMEVANKRIAELKLVGKAARNAVEKYAANYRSVLQELRTFPSGQRASLSAASYIKIGEFSKATHVLERLSR